MLVLSGTPAERGLAHGEAARPLIAEAVERWDEIQGSCAGAVLTSLVDDAGFVRAARRWTPALAEEVEAIAKGANVDRRRVWALNLLDESWWVRRQLDGGPSAPGEPLVGCSGFGIAARRRPAAAGARPGAGPGAGDDVEEAQVPLLAQNMDLPTWLDGLQLLLDVRPTDGPRALVPTYAGCIGTTALNEHGLGVCVNTLSQLPTSLDGVPVALVIRHLAACRSAAEARATARALPHASGQNYLFGDPDQLTDLECGAGVIDEPPVRAGRMAHTNHPLGAPAPDEGGVVAASGARLRALEDALEALPVVRPADAQRILRSPPLNREPDASRAFTFNSVVMELAPTPVLHLTDGPPARSDYVSRRFAA